MDNTITPTVVVEQEIFNREYELYHYYTESFVQQNEQNNFTPVNNNNNGYSNNTLTDSGNN